MVFSYRFALISISPRLRYLTTVTSLRFFTDFFILEPPYEEILLYPSIVREGISIFVFYSLYYTMDILLFILTVIK